MSLLAEGFELETNLTNLLIQEKTNCLKNKQGCLKAVQAGAGAGLVAITDHQ
jgi:hypothetical protein